MLTVVVVALAGVVVWKLVLTGGIGAKRLECPACDLYILGARPSEGDAVLCGSCRAWGLYKAGKLERVADDFVAAAPMFCAELPLEGLRWPAVCPVCSQSATRTVPMRLTYTQDASFGADLATRAATLGMFKAVSESTVSLEIPHCAHHADGAKLTMPWEREQSNFGVAFRSYTYFREFVQLNHATPRKASMFDGPSNPG
jgi:hypothetical protein